MFNSVESVCQCVRAMCVRYMLRSLLTVYDYGKFHAWMN